MPVELSDIEALALIKDLARTSRGLAFGLQYANEDYYKVAKNNKELGEIIWSMREQEEKFLAEISRLQEELRDAQKLSHKIQTARDREKTQYLERLLELGVNLDGSIIGAERA